MGRGCAGSGLFNGAGSGLFNGAGSGLLQLPAFAFVADGVGKLQIGFGVAAACRAGRDVVEAWPPFFPQCRMGQFEAVLGHRLPAQGALAVLLCPELTKKRRIGRSVRYGHTCVYQTRLPCVSCVCRSCCQIRWSFYRRGISARLALE